MNAQDFYRFEEDPTIKLLHFTLETSRHEPALKRAKILMEAGKFSNDANIHYGCYDLANELLDVEQIVQKYIALVLEAYAPELAENDTWRYLLERIEDQPLETKEELLGSMTMLEKRHVAGLDESWLNLRLEVTRFNHAFDTFLFKLRTRFHHGSNRAALARWQEEKEADTGTQAIAAFDAPKNAAVMGEANAPDCAVPSPTEFQNKVGATVV